jgi:GTPase SAR1 family protein
MNILMIGHSRAGKTSFMAALYRYLGGSIDGYGIKAIGTQKTELELLTHKLSKGIFPTGTDIASEYNFQLTIHGDSIIPFNWYDYRGGVLTEDNDQDEEIHQLTKKIENADALIIFLDGVKLENHKKEYEIEYDILKTCIESALGTKNNNIFPIIVVR